MAGEASPFVAGPDGVRVRVRLTPRGGVDRIEVVVAGADGRALLKARVAAPAEGGKANAALVRLLADTAGVAPSRVSLVGGAKDRVKTVLIAGDATRILDRLSRTTGETS